MVRLETGIVSPTSEAHEAKPYLPVPEALPKKNNRIQQALRIATDTFDVLPENLFGDDQSPNSKTARYTFVEALLLRNIGYIKIGSLFGDRNPDDIRVGLEAHHQYLQLHPEADALASVATQKIDEIWPITQENNTIRQTLYAVSEAYYVSIDDICGKNRDRTLSEARFVVAYLLRRTGMYLKRVTLVLGYKDHSAVISGVKKITKLKQDDPEFASRLSELENQIDTIREKSKEEKEIREEITIQGEAYRSSDGNMVRQETDVVSPTLEAHEAPSEETEIPKIDALDELITAVCYKFEGDPSLILNKGLRKLEHEETILAQSALIHLLILTTVPQFQIQILLNSSEIFVKNKLSHLTKARRLSSQIDEIIGQLKDDLPWVRDALDSRRTVEQVREMVVFYTRIPWGEIISPIREKSVVRARNIAMHLLRESGWALKSIGRVLGNRSHSTVIHGLSKLKEDKGKDTKLGKALPILENGVDAIVRRQELREAIDRRISNREAMRQRMIVVFEEKLKSSPDSNS